MLENEHENSALAQAIEMVGSQDLFAQRVGVTQQAVSKWLKNGKIPAERVVLAEQATAGKITRQKLRPDLYRSKDHTQ